MCKLTRRSDDHDCAREVDREHSSGGRERERAAAQHAVALVDKVRRVAGQHGERARRGEREQAGHRRKVEHVAALALALALALRLRALGVVRRVALVPLLHAVGKRAPRLVGRGRGRRHRREPHLLLEQALLRGARVVALGQQRCFLLCKRASRESQQVKSEEKRERERKKRN